jgi:hypothetical protein
MVTTPMSLEDVIVKSGQLYAVSVENEGSPKLFAATASAVCAGSRAQINNADKINAIVFFSLDLIQSSP